MSTRAPADIGMRLEDVDTPALLVDLDAFEANLRRMAQAAAIAGIALRPHAKTHKSPVIALKQIELGAVGVCCQKVSEAQAMVYGGVRDVLISNEIAGAAKIERLAALARHAKVGVCVDDAENAKALSAAAQRFGATLDVLVEINVGANRCGVAPGEPALALARLITTSPGLHFAGLQAYHGAAQHVREFETRKEAIACAVRQTALTRDLLRQHGLACSIIGGAGTGTYQIEAASEVYNELQVGSYVFMDADYAKNRAADGGPVKDFEHSLFVLTTVMSRTQQEQAVVDAGLKAMSFDSGMPWVHAAEGAEYVSASDEHGKLRLGKGCRDLRLGDKIMLIPGHCDPTVNLHDWYIGIRGQTVEAVWPISARGPGF